MEWCEQRSSGIAYPNQSETHHLATEVSLQDKNKIEAIHVWHWKRRLCKLVWCSALNLSYRKNDVVTSNPIWNPADHFSEAGMIELGV